MSNLGLEQALNEDGVEFVRSQVGDRYVLSELLKRNWTLGGESSGHIVNLDYTTTGDGILSALQVLRIMCMTASSLSALKQQMIKRPQIMENVPLFDTFDLNDFPEVQQCIAQQEKKLGRRGRVLVRPSGTERCLRVMAEGEDLAEIQMVVSKIVCEVKRVLEKVH